METMVKSLIRPQDEAEPEVPVAKGPLDFKNISLPGILRTAGSCILVAASATFLLQDWTGLDDNLRYFAFLAFTIVLALAGFLCGVRIQEARGARTFLALVAAVIPVHFCVLGGLLFSKFGMQTGLHYPKSLHWVAASPLAALTTTGIGVGTLAVLCALAFMSLARSETRRLTVTYLAANALLLIPTRDPGMVGITAAILFAALLTQDLVKLGLNSAMRTFEGKLVRLMLFVPVLMLIGRTVFLYSMSSIFVSMLLASLAVFLFVAIPSYYDKVTSQLSQQLSVIPAALAWLVITQNVFDTLGFLVDFKAMTVELPIALTLAVMSLYAIGGGAGFRKAAAFLAIQTMTIQLIGQPGLASSLMYVVTSVLTIIYGFSTKQRAVFNFGSIGLLFGLVYHIRYAVTLYSFSPWLGLALTGISVVIGASVLERHGEKVKTLIAHIR